MPSPYLRAYRTIRQAHASNTVPYDVRPIRKGRPLTRKASASTPDRLSIRYVPHRGPSTTAEDGREPVVRFHWSGVVTSSRWGVSSSLSDERKAVPSPFWSAVMDGPGLLDPSRQPPRVDAS